VTNVGNGKDESVGVALTSLEEDLTELNRYGVILGSKGKERHVFNGSRYGVLKSRPPSCRTLRQTPENVVEDVLGVVFGPGKNLEMKRQLSAMLLRLRNSAENSSKERPVSPLSMSRIDDCMALRSSDGGF